MTCTHKCNECGHSFSDYNFESAWDSCRMDHWHGEDLDTHTVENCNDFITREEFHAEYVTKRVEFLEKEVKELEDKGLMTKELKWDYACRIDFLHDSLV